MSSLHTRHVAYLFLVILGSTLWLSGLFNELLAQTIDRAANRAANGVALSLEGAVTPTAADYLTREIEIANDENADLIIIRIDTPGGLVESMKTIIKGILASNTPVVTYVAPKGARSASAGLYIMYSAHISAMAPATNTGAATPIQIGETPDKSPNVLNNNEAAQAKAINDSVAYIRSLGEERNRNTQWAQEAITQAASITANEALKLNVIDIIATDQADLLRQIDGRAVTTAGGEVIIRTEGIVMREVMPTFLEQVLGFLANPNVAAILLSLGTMGIIIEMWNPGSIFPGAVGLLSLIFAFYSFQALPFQALPFAIMGLGLVLIVTEAYTPTFGIAGIFGALLFGGGLYTLFPGELRVSLNVFIVLMVMIATFLTMVLIAVARTHSRGPLLGHEAIKGREGRVDDWNHEEGTGHVIVEGERWRARSNDTLEAGDRIIVTKINGLVLHVKARKSDTTVSRLLPRPRKETP